MTTSVATGACALAAGTLASYAGCSLGQPPVVGLLLLALGAAHVGVALWVRYAKARTGPEVNAPARRSRRGGASGRRALLV